jgi:hypothetical protein
VVTAACALLGQLLAHHLALERREIVDEQLAVQVIHLVLDAGASRPSASSSLGWPSRSSTHGDAVGAGHVGIDAGHRQAAFLVDLIPVLATISGLMNTCGSFFSR